MEHRGHEYFDQTLKLINIFGLLKKEEVKSSFEKIVIDDIPNQIEDKILDLIDWMVEQEFRQWKNILKLISLRQNNIPDKINSDPGSAALNYDRKRLIEDIQTSTSEIINTFDRKKEATNIANSAQEAVAATAALGAGAIGIGTIITSLTTTLAIDISGVILAGALAIIGVIIIPSRRKKINKTLSVKIQELRFQIASTLKSQFSKEITNSKNNILNAFMPYFNFITAENENLRNALQDFNTINTKTHQLKNKIDTLN